MYLSIISTQLASANYSAQPTPPRFDRIRARLLGFACIAILGGILVACLWPFHAPANRVQSLPGGTGLRFSRRGTVLSAGRFAEPSGPGRESCAIEIWLVPARTWDRGTILAFYRTDGSVPFSLHQLHRDLMIEIHAPRATSSRGASELYVRRVLYAGRSVFLSITSDGGGTEVYVDGQFAGESPTFDFTRRDLTGQLILGTSPATDNSWSGILRGLAIYQYNLTGSAALDHYRSWTGSGQPALNGATPVALYLFGRSPARIITNQAGGGPNLAIPSHYQVVGEVLLERPWDEYASNWSYWESVLMNIAGFIPFGFLFYAYFSFSRQWRSPALITILMGAAVSVTVEVLQSYLPTRYSGVTDIFTNTLGTAAGVGLYCCAKLLLETTLGRSRSQRTREIVSWLVTTGYHPAGGTKAGIRSDE